MAETWFTYPALAQHWGMSQDAARTRARRGHYPRRVNNQGQAEVLVDSSALPLRVRPPRAGGQSQTAATLPAPATESPPTATAEALGAIAALEAHVATLKDQLTQAEARADKYEHQIDAERERVADLVAQVLRLTRELLDAKKEEQNQLPRSWWQRLVG